MAMTHLVIALCVCLSLMASLSFVRFIFHFCGSASAELKVSQLVD